MQFTLESGGWSICAFRLEWNFFASLMSPSGSSEINPLLFPFPFQAVPSIRAVITCGVAPGFSVLSLIIQAKAAPGDTFC